MIEEAFIALQAARGLRSGSLSRPVMFGEMVHYIHGTAEVDELRVEEQIGSNLSLRRQFNQLLEAARVATAPKQALAASEEASVDDGKTKVSVAKRETRSFTLAFKHSKANADQIYVLLTVHPESGMADGHAPVVLASKQVGPGGASEVEPSSEKDLSVRAGLLELVRLCFPPLKDHRAQLLLVTGDQRLVLAQDSDAELSLL